MKFEDGRIVPVEVEEKRHYPNNHSPENIDSKDRKSSVKDDIQQTAKKIGTWKSLKILGAIAIIIFFMYTIKDVYVAFFTDTEKTTDETTKPEEITKITGNQSDNDLPGTLNKAVSNAPTNQKNHLPSLEEEKENSKSNLEIIINSSNSIEEQMITDMNQSISIMLLYYDNKANRKTVESKLTHLIQNQEELQTYLKDRKTIYDKEKALDYYQVLSERIQNAKQLGNVMYTSYEIADKETLISQINQYIGQENVLKKKQNHLFIQLLKTHDIEYTTDDNSGLIQYNLSSIQ